MKKIIIVDDDPAIQDAFRLILERAGFSVTVYSNGHPLLAEDFIAPDLIIMDRQLSGADGLDICRVLRQRPAMTALPIIMLSASPSIQQLALAAGASAFLEKPFKLKELLDLIGKLIPVKK